MATTNFVDGLTVVVADWLNDVDEHVYQQDTTAHQAAHITVTPAGGITSTDVQAALVELDSDLVAGLASGLATKANLSGATFTGAINVPAGATGTQAPQVQEVVSKTSTTGSAVMPAGTTAQRDGSPASGYTRPNSDLLAVESYLGSEWVPMRTVQGVRVATTSGTSFDFTNIPAWVTRIDIMPRGVSLSGTDSILIQLGGASGFLVTGYASTSIRISSAASATGDTNTTGFVVSLGVAGNTWTGRITIHKVRDGSRAFIQDHNGKTSTSVVAWGGGDVEMTEELTQIRIKTNGANSFDAGEIVMYWS